MTDPYLKQLEDRIALLEWRFNVYTSAQSLERVSKIYPKTNTVIFVGKDYFGDNIKYSYLAFNEFAKTNDLASYFLTDDEKQIALLEACRLPYLTTSDPRYLPILLAAKVVVMCDFFHQHEGRAAISHALLQGAKSIQLWHGIPIKEIGLKVFYHAEIMASCGTYQAFVASNVSSQGDWAQRFSFREFAAIGHPRNDVFFRDPTVADLINVDNEAMKLALKARRDGKRVVFYAPTFREQGSAAWFEKARITELADYCRAHDHLFLINLHPIEQHATTKFRQHNPGIRFIEPHTDAYPLLKYADLLITDYSSVAFDFLLLDRPLLFYRPDHDEYVTNSRPLIKDREHYTPGPVSLTMEELIVALKAASPYLENPGNDPYQEARHVLCQTLFDYRDGQAGMRVNNLIQKYLSSTE